MEDTGPSAVNHVDDGSLGCVLSNGVGGDGSCEWSTRRGHVRSSQGHSGI